MSRSAVSNNTGRGAIRRLISALSASSSRPGIFQQGQLPTDRIPSFEHIHPLITAAFMRSSQAASNIAHSPPIESPATPIFVESTSGRDWSTSTARIRSHSTIAAYLRCPKLGAKTT